MKIKTSEVNTYLFYVETGEGARIEWRGLSQRTATMMYNLTLRKRRSGDLKGFGWKVIKEDAL